MIINTAYDYDKMKQIELCAQLDVPDKVVKGIVYNFLNNLDYKERQQWIAENIKIQTEITEEEL
tara:strand:+ start:144 stop:335 length:192 start_codon:yes stop_codon:yes gene_type:complete